jgi:hypothetical protein
MNHMMPGIRDMPDRRFDDLLAMEVFEALLP